MKKKTSYNMTTRMSALQLTHKQVLRLFPMETGYLVEEDGQPCANSLSIAVILQTICQLSNPYKELREYVN